MHYQLGVALRKLGQTEEAATHLAEARRLGEPAREGTGAPDSPGAESPEARPRRMRLSSRALPWRSSPARSRRAAPARGRGPGPRLPQPGRAASPEPDARPGAASASPRRRRSSRARPSSTPTSRTSSRRWASPASMRDSSSRPSPPSSARAPPRPTIPACGTCSRCPCSTPEAWDRAAELLRGDRSARDGSFAAVRLRPRPRSGRPRRRGREVLSRLIAQQGESAELRGLLGQASRPAGQGWPGRRDAGGGDPAATGRRGLARRAGTRLSEGGQDHAGRAGVRGRAPAQGQAHERHLVRAGSPAWPPSC